MSKVVNLDSQYEVAGTVTNFVDYANDAFLGFNIYS
jgi:hypothetical protein